MEIFRVPIWWLEVKKPEREKVQKQTQSARQEEIKYREERNRKRKTKNYQTLRVHNILISSTAQSNSIKLMHQVILSNWMYILYMSYCIWPLFYRERLHWLQPDSRQTVTFGLRRGGRPILQRPPPLLTPLPPTSHYSINYSQDITRVSQ